MNYSHQTRNLVGVIHCIAHHSGRNGVSSLAIKFDDHAVDVSFTQTSLHFVLADGREISAPLEWFPKLRVGN